MLWCDVRVLAGAGGVEAKQQLRTVLIKIKLML
jgi:hypothetical protein